MKTLYLDCGMGAAGDMLTAALLELHPAPEGFLVRLNAAGIPHVHTRLERVKQCGVCGSRVAVEIDGKEEQPDGETATHPHHHRPLPDVESILNGASVGEKARGDALAVYRLLAEAESTVHGVPVSEIHFHEVGQLDAIADVLAVCMLLEELSPDRILASPVHVGGGYVHCAHGLLPVPAPATAELLRGIPQYTGEIPSELCTPTGAALLRHFCSDFGPMPVMRVEAIGCGMGKKDFERLNAVRAFWGESDEESAGELLYELACNLDDCTGEALGFAQEELLKAGALDVWTAPIGMKKGRPAVQLCCLCREADREALLRLLFRHTPTLGVRVFPCTRYALRRESRTAETPLGPVRMKTAEGYGVRREKPEYEDLARLARENGLSLDEVRERL